MSEELIESPKTYNVAVLSAYKQRFDHWVKENSKPNEIYHCVMSERDALGWWFDRVEYSYQWWRIDNSIQVERICKRRLN